MVQVDLSSKLLAGLLQWLYASDISPTTLINPDDQQACDNPHSISDHTSFQNYDC